MATAFRLESQKDGRMSIISLKNIGKTFSEDGRDLVALKDINLAINTGEFFIFLGPSGSGKSTLLRIMSGLEKSFHGTVSLGKNISKTDFSFIFQQFALLPWLTVFENVELGLLARDVPKSERYQRVMEELKKLGLEKFAKSVPKQISGGMKQRVGIARALVTNPQIILMDEPFSSLDSFTAEELRKEVLSIWQKTKTTIVMVTHLISEALELADRVAVLTPRPGSIEQILDIPLLRPRQKRSQDFYDMEDKLYKLIKF